MEKKMKKNSGVVLHESERMKLKAQGGSGGAINFTDHGGPVLANCQLQLIFWGSVWSNSGNTPSSTDVINAVHSIVTGQYMTGLNQYRGINKAVLHGTNVFTGSNPPNPFSDTDVQNFITGCINAGALPDPASSDQLLYMVIMPPGVSAGGSFIGEHSYYTRNGVNVHYSWITNNGTLNYVTPILSHELVESVTDPEGSAILGDPGSCNQGGWREIGDVCYYNFVLHGVTVQKYWSQNDHTCYPTDAVKNIWDSVKWRIKEVEKFHFKELHPDKYFIYDKAHFKDIKELEYEIFKNQVEQVVDPFEKFIDEIQKINERVSRLEEVIKKSPFIKEKDRPAVGKSVAKSAKKGRNNS